MTTMVNLQLRGYVRIAASETLRKDSPDRRVSLTGADRARILRGSFSESERALRMSGMP